MIIYWTALLLYIIVNYGCIQQCCYQCFPLLCCFPLCSRHTAWAAIFPLMSEIPSYLNSILLSMQLKNLIPMEAQCPDVWLIPMDSNLLHVQQILYTFSTHDRCTILFKGPYLYGKKKSSMHTLTLAFEWLKY